MPSLNNLKSSTSPSMICVKSPASDQNKSLAPLFVSSSNNLLLEEVYFGAIVAKATAVILYF